ncbi:hypothetical protein FALCPG4_016132 [Fusarium falciforme]
MRRFNPLFFLFSYPVVGAMPSAHLSTRDVEGLDWKPCDLPLPETVKNATTVPVDCATLEVPLDYTNPKSDKKLQLQLVKVNATEKLVKGSVIFNPGGPGSSGVEEVTQKGPLYVKTLGGHFNVIGFDARGTGRTLPFICDTGSAAPGTPESTKLSRRDNKYPHTYSDVPPSPLYDLLKYQVWELSAEYAKICVERNKENATFYGTAFVARDMLAIVDALKEDGLLRFWGRSYSTILGQTFAAMFPDRVGRMLLDAVVIPDEYYSGTWLSALSGVESTILRFFEECVDAGVDYCPLANFTGPDTTAQGLMDATVDVWEELAKDPVLVSKDFPIPYLTPGNVSVLLASKAQIHSALYEPASFTGMFQVLVPLLNRNFSMWTDPVKPETPEEQEEPWNISLGPNFHAIGCSDSTFRADSPEDMYNIVEGQNAQSSFGEILGPKTWMCARWPVFAAERYEGEWQGLNTSFPLLFANGQWDPITPLTGAWNAASRFKGSRVLTHEGFGHGVMKQPSDCTKKAIRAYFQDGILPELGTKCKPNKSSFEQFAVDLEKGVGTAPWGNE